MHCIVAKNDAVCQIAQSSMFPNPAIYQESRVLMHNESCLEKRAFESLIQFSL